MPIQRKLFYSFIVITTLLLNGCGSGDSQAVTTSKLKGTWETQCRNLQDNTSEKSVLNFTKEKLTRSEYRYDDIGCKERDIMKHLDVSYRYTLGEDITTADGKKATKVTTSVTGFEIVKGAFSNDEIPQFGKIEKSIVMIDAGQLYVGEDKAPYQLNYQEYFSKIK